MSECTHDCSTCSANCSSRKAIEKEKLNEVSSVKHVIGVVSGKGGVGKSIVTSMLAVASQRQGFNTAIIDADITGPSIPRAFGVKDPIMSDGEHMLPSKSKTGIDIMSINLMLEDETRPVVWRGSMIAGVVKQFWTDPVWKDIDFMYVDMPPGTGDVPLTVYQSLPLDGIVIVTTPQDLVSMIVEKAVKMANMMNVPVLGLVENMSYVVCPDCGKHINIFGEGKVNEIAERYGFDVLAKLPMDRSLAGLCDNGQIELVEDKYMAEAFNVVEKKLNK